MLGIMMNDIERGEIEYLLKRELEEVLMDLEDPRIDSMIKKSMEHRYQILFNLYRRVTCESEYAKYILKKNKRRP
ncbi:MAG TPA: hypothetical protein VK119_00285 [Bacillota bacterium]|nr:hypothetical protein [Bacillota bacterium]